MEELHAERGEDEAEGEGGEEESPVDDEILSDGGGNWKKSIIGVFIGPINDMNMTLRYFEEMIFLHTLLNVDVWAPLEIPFSNWKYVYG